MASNFPTSLDTNPGDPQPTDLLSKAPHSSLHAFAQDAIVAIETYIGIVGSAVTTTLTYLLTSTSSIDPGHRHTPASGGTGVYSTPSKGELLAGTGTGFSLESAGADGQILTADSSQANGIKWGAAPLSASAIFFGTGNDGTYTLDGTQAAVAGLFSKSGNNYTLLRDAYFNSLSVSSGVILYTGGYKLYCTGTLSGAGTIDNSGGNASGTTGGTGGAGGSMQAAPAGGNGGGTNGTSRNPSVGVSGASGGSSGINSGGSGTQAGGSAGTATSENLEFVFSNPDVPITSITAGVETALAIVYAFIGATSGTTISSSAGSGGGGSNGGAGGGAGGTGGNIYIAASTINMTGTISANGGNAANGANGNGAGGGGGGGSGGVVMLIYTSLTVGSVTVTAGTKGTGGTGSGGGANGTAGNDGTAGKIYKVKVSLTT